MSARGFTLIEAIFAVALSMVVVATAVAGVRLAMQSVTAANRYAIENGMIRAGYFAAVDEADFWRDYDDPSDPANERLRGFDAGPDRHRGLPFTPFDTAAFPRAGATGSEDERGWDPAYQWPASDPRSWFQGNLVEEVGRTLHRFGHYEIFCHVKPKPTLDRAFPNGVPYAAWGEVACSHTWLCNQLEGLKDALGYYGVTEYMPANAIYGVHGDPGGDNAYGDGPGDPRSAGDDDQSLSKEWCEPAGDGGGVQYRFANDDGGTAWPRGLYRLVRDSTYPIVPASALTSAGTGSWPLPDLVAAHCRSWATDRVGSASDSSPGNHGIDDLLRKTDIVMPLLARRPAAWPGVTRSVMRYLNNCRFTALSKIRWISPMTGESAEISFTLVATSLRGARQQRSPIPGGGWAKPGQPNLDAP